MTIHRARKKGKFGFVDVSGNTVVDFAYAGASDSDGSIWWLQTDDNELHIIESNSNITGKIQNVEFACPPSEGLICFCRNDIWGVCDEHGHEVISPNFESLTPFVDGRANAKLNGKWGTIIADGEFVVEPRWNVIQDWQPNSIFTGAQSTESSNWVLIDLHGQTIGEQEFEMAWSGGTEVAPVDFLENSKSGLADSTGKTCIEGRFENINSRTSSETVAVQDGDFWGIIDFDGKSVVKPTYTYIAEESEGLRLAYSGGRRIGYGLREGKYGYIDSKGKEWIRPQFDGASDFEFGLAIVRIGPPGPKVQQYLMNKKGEFVFRNT